MALKMADDRQSADETEETAEEVQAVAKKKPPIVLICLLILLLVAIGCGVKFYLNYRAHVKAAPVVLKVGETLPLDEFMMNLADDGNMHYIKTTLALGLKEGVTADSFKDKIPQTRDAIVLVLSSKKLSDVTTTAQKIALKEEIKDAVNQSLGGNDVVAVYYQAFATQ